MVKIVEIQMDKPKFRPESSCVVTHRRAYPLWLRLLSGFLLGDVMKKHTLEYVRSKIEEAGYELLSDEYVHAQSKLKVKCDKGHEYAPTFDSFCQGRRCYVCGGSKKLTIEYIKSEVKRLEPDYRCLSETYINSTIKLLFRCAEGHEYSTPWASFQQGSRCTICDNVRRANLRRFKIEDVKEETKKYAVGYKCLSNEYNSVYQKLHFVCDVGHSFNMSWHHFKNLKHRCSICGIINNANKRRLPLSFIKKETERIAFGYKCLSKNYIGNKQLLQFKCDKGHKFKMSWNNIQHGIRCPICARENSRIHDEEALQNIQWYRAIVTRYTNENFIKYYYQINPDKLSRSFVDYHVDHIFTVIDGFNNQILPQIIANPTNLQMLSAFDNGSKSGTSHMTKDELFEKYEEFKKGEEDGKY